MGVFDTAGIARIEFDVTADTPRLSIDHLQFGLNPLAGDADVDGLVDFLDFNVLASNFDMAVSFLENLLFG